ncbi:DUF1750-domain-containing protein [Lasiosphaeria miniovina]|uniref:DUF1750-domain-containing protein n=1 Tax=Lasiosphaeria miniovina TaxID=1954250 RepID=A0AA39ZU65_9PEZI|nr:DUF1750-domain-containing protein [Lasiosphaeria miniovina]KAK0703723.1 DUF1750-domain-containing protein [Lasiosphaeria miniovina]
MAGDPSQNVHGDLLPHVHLLSTFRYALMPRVDPPEVTKWLLSAPKIARDTAPFYWTYLDCPADGTIFLTWQPTARRSVEYASDGYVWAGPEISYRNEMGNGLYLEAFYQKAGFRIGEQFTVHSRRRFRLMPPQVPVQNVPQVDPNLWIIHYGPSEKADRLPVNMIPATPPMQQTMNIRQHLFHLGQIVRKEFMLSDRVNWPHLPLPGRGQSMYAAPMPARNVPQAMAYPPNPSPAIGPTPRQRRPGPGQGQAHPPQVMGAPYQAMEGAFDDDEDTSRGDLFDHLSPREVSLSRYQQNHEWMEEILSSPYQIGQIEVADLGLGRRGELGSLTQGIFEAQGSDALADGPKTPYTGHLDPELAEEFRKRVQEKTISVKEEIEKMKEKHNKQLAKFKGNAVINQAEQELRASTQGTGPEIWRLEGRLEDDEGVGHGNQRQGKSIEDILASVEEVVGKQAVVVHDVHRVQDGGYQEPAPEPEPEPEPRPEPVAQSLPTQAESALPPTSMSRQPSQAGSQNSGVMVGDSDIDMGGTAAGLLDQMHTGFSSTSTPINNFPTPQPHLSALPSNAATPANLNVPSPHAAPAPTSQPPAAVGEDVKMEDAEAARGTTTGPDQGTGSDDWVVVPKGGVSPGSASNPMGSSAGNQPVGTAAETNTATADSGPSLAHGSKPASAAATPADGLAFDADNNDFSSLGDLDTAGDALAGYDPPSIDAGGLGDLHMDMEDSAFGDAFHGVEQSGGNTPADGNVM